jgi:ribosomal protein L31E
MYIKVGSNRKIRKTMKGWHLCVEWKYGTTSWERLADLNESNPVEVAEYAKTYNLHDEQDFAWWVPHVLKKRNRIISAATKRYHKRTHKFGIQVPKTWDETVKLDEENGNTLWKYAIKKVMNNVRIAFKVLNDEEAIPPTYQ